MLVGTSHGRGTTLTGPVGSIVAVPWTAAFHSHVLLLSPTVTTVASPTDEAGDPAYSATEVHASGAYSWTVFIASRASVRLS